MVVYNIPALSGVKLTLDQINTLVTLPGVSALKQTSGDLFQMEQIRRAHPDLVLYNGYDEIFAFGLLAGADGGIGSTYNIMGWRYQGLCRHYVRAMWRKRSVCKPSAIRLLIY